MDIYLELDVVFRRRAPLSVKAQLLAATGLAMLLSAPAAAQAVQADPGANAVSEIIVTAQKRQEAVNTVPMSITAVTGVQLRDAGIDQPRDLVKVTPGFSYADSYVGSPRREAPCPRRKFAPVRAGDVPAEWVLPHKLLGDERIVLLHGGGWVASGLNSHRPMAAALAEMSGLAVLLVDYRLAPEHPFPAGFEDCWAAFAWALENGQGGAGAASRVFLMGDSAGGNLSAAVCVDAIASGAHTPDRLVLMSPALDGSANPARGAAAAANGDQASLEAMMSLYLQSRAATRSTIPAYPRSWRRRTFWRVFPRR